MTIPEIYTLFKKSTGISTDTRNVEKGQLFFALKGGNFNGNLYATKALELGAFFVIIDEEEQKKDERYILVHNVLHTLQLLANYHRQQFNIPVVAITGTNGKTTTKELMAAVLSKKFNLIATKGNLNNHIGVPLTLLSITDRTELAIIEMGANKIGDIRELCSFANPTHGVVINVGKAHLEGFGSFEGVIQTKTELYDYLYNTDQMAFVNGNQPELVANTARLKQATFFQHDASNTCTLVDSVDKLVVKLPSKEVVQTHLVGAYNLDNIGAAVAFGRYFDVLNKDICVALEGYVPTNNRSQVIKVDKGVVVLDAYNANPSSMKVALENLTLSEYEQYAILGDMFELGEYADEEHLKVIKQAQRIGVQTIFCGQLFYKHKQYFSELLFFKTNEELIIYLNSTQWMKPNGVLLIKGSRGMALEKLIEQVKF